MAERGDRKNKIGCIDGGLTLVIVRAIVCGKEKIILEVGGGENFRRNTIQSERREVYGKADQ